MGKTEKSVDRKRLALIVAGLFLGLGMLPAGVTHAQSGETVPHSYSEDIAVSQHYAPVAYDDEYTATEDMVLDTAKDGWPTVLDNDFGEEEEEPGDDEDDLLMAAKESEPRFGDLVLNKDGSFIYTPNHNFHGTDSFQYTAYQPEEGASAPATVTITVLPVNDAPIAHDDTYTTTEDHVLDTVVDGWPTVLSNDFDIEDDTLQAVKESEPQFGDLVLHEDGSFLYTPPENFHGTDTFRYTARDADGGISVPATVTINVMPDQYIEVSTVEDDPANYDGVCDWLHCSLREAIILANSDPETNTVIFEIPGDAPHIFLPSSALPAIEAPAIVDGRLQDDGSRLPRGRIVLDGSRTGEGVDGLTILAGGQGSTISGLTIINFSGSGIGIGATGQPSNGNIIQDNEIAYNGEDGITVYLGTNNQLQDNEIHDNGDLGIDLGGDGPTPNDQGDGDEGANDFQNYPVLFRATPDSDGNVTAVEGWLDGQPETTYSVELFASQACDKGEQVELPLISNTVTITDSSEVYFTLTVDQALAQGTAIRATATGPNGNTSEFSGCVLVSKSNDSWPNALDLTDSLVESAPGIFTATEQQYLDLMGQSRWYKFKVEPHSEVEITLTDLPANYDLTLYKDIAQVYQSLLGPKTEEDLKELSAQFAPGAFSPGAFSPGAFSPGAFSPGAFSPGAFSPGAFSPGAFSPGAFSPGAFSPGAFSPDAYSPGAFSPGAFSPGAFSPGAFSPGAFSPGAFSPKAFSDAQMRSLIGVSAFEGRASEGLKMKTWLNDGYFFVRVRGRNGVFSQEHSFTVSVTLKADKDCDTGWVSGLPPNSLPDSDSLPSDITALILTDLSRMEGTTESLVISLTELAAATNGVWLDVGDDARVAAANNEADSTYVTCPYAKNVVSQSIKNIVNAYRSANSGLKYVVIAGNDDVIPFFRYPDNALLGHESNFFPPVLDDTTSQASLRLGYVLSQDAYGSSIDLSINAAEFPVADLAVGRLVETVEDIIMMIDVYLTSGEVRPQYGLSSGYDFMEDAALAVEREYDAVLGVENVDSLITPYTASPLDLTLAEGGTVWTGDDLRNLLLNHPTRPDRPYDVAYLAGHFSASSLLAADYSTGMIAQELIDSPVDMRNAVFYSNGCHSGYNIVNDHGVPFVTPEPDWAQVFARKGATLIAGTGYQYGDTEFLEYSERLYLLFTQQLVENDSIAVGEALAAAKQQYLATTPSLRGIHEKALLQATLFGLPMLMVNMPGAGISPAAAEVETPAIEALTPVLTKPGASLSLYYADLPVSTTLVPKTTVLTNVEETTETKTATYLEGSNGIVTNPAEPALPLEMKNVTAPSVAPPAITPVLRGVGFRSASYTDINEIIPLTGAPTTEIRGVHSPFLSDVFFPLRPWNVNYFDALVGGSTLLALTPAQHKSTLPGSQTSTLRQYDMMDFRLYYSGKVDDGESGDPANAAPPTVVSVNSTIDGAEISFAVRVAGNPAAGMQEVWVTLTGDQPPSSGTGAAGPLYGEWRSFDLSQSDQDSTLWTGTVDVANELGVDTLTQAEIRQIRYMVQAANGIGLVTLSDNLGRYHIPGVADDPLVTELELDESYPQSGPFGTKVTFEATLSAEGEPLAGQVVYFALGVQTRVGTTDANGKAIVEIPLLGLPGAYEVRAAFPGSVTAALDSTGPVAYAESSDSGKLFTITRQNTEVCLDVDSNPSDLTAFNSCDDTNTSPPSGLATADFLLAAVLPEVGDDSIYLAEQTIFFELTGPDSITVPAITNFFGRATLGNLPESLAYGVYAVKAIYQGTIPYAGSTIVGKLKILAPSPEVLLYLPVMANPGSGTAEIPGALWLSDVAERDLFLPAIANR